jgi:hypothetical protein
MLLTPLVGKELSFLVTYVLSMGATFYFAMKEEQD